MAAAGTNRIEPLPITPEEVTRHGWDAVDVVFVTGDAYVDHPSFAMAVLGRVLEAAGFIAVCYSGTTAEGDTVMLEQNGNNVSRWGTGAYSAIK